jgi:glycosyltransferase A (GT-A) superfamily protein (DUF2064 family)
MARAPVPGQCKKHLAGILGAAGAARLHAAMLRDTLDARARVSASRHVVLVAPEGGGAVAIRALVPPPWEIVEQSGGNLEARLGHALAHLAVGGGSVALMDGDAPTVPAASLSIALHAFAGGRRALLGPCAEGGAYLLALTEVDLEIVRSAPRDPTKRLDFARARCAELGFDYRELAEGYEVKDPGGLERLRLELAGHPERAPRTAQFLRDNPP